MQTLSPLHRLPIDNSFHVQSRNLTKMKSFTPSLGLLAAFVTSTQAGLRFPCSTLTNQRLDPAAQPGALPSAHLHMIVGGNAFNATM